MTTYIIAGSLGVIVLYFILTYNRLIRNRNSVSESWSGIDVHLRKRYNLVPNLINTVKGYATHEKELFTQITEQRAEAMKASDVTSQKNAENKLSRSFANIMAVAENYPDLKANTNFLDLQRQLADIEEDIEMSRRYYNGTVRNMNNLVETFPSLFVAKSFGFSKNEYFEIENASERINPKVEF